jgi:hypothetical protein
LIDARAWRRYAAYGTPIELAWWDGPEFRTSPGLLKNISQGGACVLAAGSPVEDSPLFIRLGGSRPTEWLQVTALAVQKSRWFRQLPRLIRLKFHKPCGTGFVQAALDVPPLDRMCPADESTVKERRSFFGLRPNPRTRRHTSQCGSRDEDDADRPHSKV